LATKQLDVASQQRTVSHSLFHQGFFFYQKQHDCLPQSPYFSACPIEDKTEIPHFDTIFVIEAKSRAVLNTLKEQTSRVYLKNGRSATNNAHARESTNPGNYGRLLHIFIDGGLCHKAGEEKLRL
jgi:hypothetical protein